MGMSVIKGIGSESLPLSILLVYAANFNSSRCIEVVLIFGVFDLG